MRVLQIMPRRKLVSVDAASGEPRRSGRESKKTPKLLQAAEVLHLKSVSYTSEQPLLTVNNVIHQSVSI
jgi:hypothetical protein